MAGRDFHRQLHDRLVDRVPGIRERYQEYRGGHAKIPSLAYLGALNFEYYVLKNEALRADSVLCPDEGRNGQIPYCVLTREEKLSWALNRS